MDLKPITDHRSPNHDDRAEAVNMIVLHYTGMQSGQEALERLCSAEAGVSAHYLVEEDGRVFALVDEDKRAWHAGLSHWQGRDNVNGCSVGIEIVNPGHQWGYRAFADPQLAVVTALVQGIKDRHSVPTTRIVGHSDVAPDRKEDPGELFPWDELARQGLAIAPVDEAQMEKATPPAYEPSLTMLRSIGYGFDDRAPVAAVLAFQRRFIPAELGQGLSPHTRSAIAAIYEVFTINR